MHRGFYEGAKRHLEEIAGVVSERDNAAGARLPVWVTGHSLGGGYANALALHLLANRATAQLFGTGAALHATVLHSSHEKSLMHMIFVVLLFHWFENSA